MEVDFVSVNSTFAEQNNSLVTLAELTVFRNVAELTALQFGITRNASGVFHNCNVLTNSEIRHGQYRT